MLDATNVRQLHNDHDLSAIRLKEVSQTGSIEVRGNIIKIRTDRGNTSVLNTRQCPAKSGEKPSAVAEYPRVLDSWK